MERDVYRRIVLANAAIAFVLVASALTAILALRSTQQQDAQVARIDQQITRLDGLRQQVRDLARTARRYLLTGDLAERERAKELSARIQATPTGVIALSRRLSDFTLFVDSGLKDAPRDPASIQEFEVSLDLVRDPLAVAFRDELEPLVAKRDLARSSRRLATGAQWALAIAVVLGLGLGAASSLLLRRALRQTMPPTVESAAPDGRHQREPRDASPPANDVIIVRELFSIAPVLDHAIRQYARTAADRGVELRADPPGYLSVVADRDRIGLVIGFHLEQALEVAPTGAEIIASATSSEHGIRFAVAHTPAIPGVRLQTAGDEESTAALCRAIVEAHGGQTGVDTTSSSQTRWFTLPIEPRVLR